MGTLVMKFGGASVCRPELFANVADIIASRHRNYSKIVVVVSAMGDTTNQLMDLARQVHPKPPRREMDMLISVGERISISLLAMALASKGLKAVSFTGSQSGIITTGTHSEARIIDVRPHRILSCLQEGRIAIVAGFQGVSRKGEITTLGRGGSDTSAVALAAALKAERVEFFKDVEGIYSEDPKMRKEAVKLSHLSYNQALEIVRKGAKVLHERAVELAARNHLRLFVTSFVDFFEKEPSTGTVIASDSSESPPETPCYEKEEE